MFIVINLLSLVRRKNRENSDIKLFSLHINGCLYYIKHCDVIIYEKFLNRKTPT